MVQLDHPQNPLLRSQHQGFTNVTDVLLLRLVCFLRENMFRHHCEAFSKHRAILDILTRFFVLEDLQGVSLQ
eukprot:12885805-Ditylum_brightwellii.AAC.1